MGMKPDVDWMAQSFVDFNKKYFGGRLTLPKFSTRCSNEYWGYYMPNGTYNKFKRTFHQKGPGTIYLNGNWEREEQDWQGTLLHEMIHMYINEVEKFYPVLPHGESFKVWANRINADGYNIMETNEKKPTDINHGNNGYENYKLPSDGVDASLLCFINQPNDPNYKTWVFRADPDDIQDCIDSAKNLKPINGADEMTIYYCYAPEIKSMPSSPTTLDGFGVLGYYAAINFIKKNYGIYLGKKNLRLFKKIPL